jgi:rubrerythrin
MFSLCKTCGYTAEPQDIFCPVCPTTIVKGRREYQRLERVMKVTK